MEGLEHIKIFNCTIKCVIRTQFQGPFAFRLKIGPLVINTRTVTYMLANKITLVVKMESLIPNIYCYQFVA